MKYRSAILLSAYCLIHSAVGAPSSDLGGEWYVPAEGFDGAIAMVEKTTGLVRIGHVSPAGNVSWQLTPTGISAVSDVATTGDTLSTNLLHLTSPYDNRVAMVKFAIGTTTTSALSNITGVGTQAVTEGRRPFRAMVGTSWNGGSQSGRLEEMQNIDVVPSALATKNHSRQTLRLEPMTDPVSGNKVAVHAYQYTPGNLGFALAQENFGVITENDLVALSGNLEFVTDVKNTAGARMIVAFDAGSSLCRQLILSSPINPSSTYTYYGTSTFPFAVRALIPVPLSGAGPMADGVIAIANDGQQAAWFRFDPSGNIINSGHTFTPTGGMFLSGVLPVAGVGMVIAESTELGLPASSYISQLWNGSEWVDKDSGSIPGDSPQTQTAASVLFFDSSPFENESSQLLGSQFLPDWSSLYVYPDALPSAIIQEGFTDSNGGLQSNGEAFLSLPAGTAYVVTNQVDQALSISSLGSTSGGFSLPDLTITPPSGNYSSPFQCSAVFSESTHTLYWRADATAAWNLYESPIGIGYTRNLQFYLQANSGGVNGPIVTRDYTFPATDLNSMDSDGDGVPDYVEMDQGLDPFGGADSDGDGASDLDEIVANTDPNDDSSVPATILGLPTGEGFILAAMAQSHTGTQAATGETMMVHGMSGTILSRAQVVSPEPALPDGNTRYATLQSRDALPQNSLIALNSPLYFDLTSGSRHGREMIRFLPADSPPPLDVSTTPLGTNIASDAADWITAAQAAALTYEPVSARTPLRPEDSAVAILLEEMWHAALAPLRPVSSPLPTLEDFSALALREQDLALEKLSDDDVTLMSLEGYYFRASLDLASIARANMEPLADAIYQFHANNYVEPVSVSSPVLPLPIDVLRTVLRGGALPTEYTGAASSTVINNARNAYNAALATGDQAFRPTATWFLEVEDGQEPGVYRRTADATDVVLLDENGERFSLDLGLGVMSGTSFQVSGFTDTPAVSGMPSMEPVTVLLQSRPLASDRDTDCNLLDDEWELFFFSEIGQDAMAEVNGSGYSLLQYFLDGIDPRGNDTPLGDAVSFTPVNSAFYKVMPSGYELEFTFPDAYASRFQFALESSTTLGAGSFAEIPATPVSLGGNVHRFTITPAMSPGLTRFFRVNIGLCAE